MWTSVLTSSLRVCIPKALIEAQGWSVGQALVFIPKGKGLLIMPVPDIEDLRGLAKGSVTREYRAHSDTDGDPSPE